MSKIFALSGNYVQRFAMFLPLKPEGKSAIRTQERKRRGCPSKPLRLKVSTEMRNYNQSYVY